MSIFKFTLKQFGLFIFLTAGLVGTVYVGLRGFVFKPGLQVSAAMPSGAAGEPVNARMLVFDSEIAGNQLAYADFIDASISEEGELKLEVPKYFTSFNSAFLQLCIGSGDGPSSSEACDNNVSTKYNYSSTGCVREPMVETGLLESFITEPVEIRFEDFCTEIHTRDEFEDLQAANSSLGELAFRGGRLQPKGQIKLNPARGDVYAIYAEKIDGLLVDGPIGSQTVGITKTELKINDHAINLAEYAADPKHTKGCYSDELLIWSNSQWECISSLELVNQSLTTVSVLGSLISYKNSDGQIFTWDLSEFSSEVTLTDYTNNTFSIEPSSGGNVEVDVSLARPVTDITDIFNGKIGYQNQISGTTDAVVNIPQVEVTDEANGVFSYLTDSGASVSFDVEFFENYATDVDTEIDGSKLFSHEDNEGVFNLYNGSLLLDGNGSSYTYVPGNSKIDIENAETVTKLEAGPNGTIFYTDEAGNTNTINISDLENSTELDMTLESGNIIGRYINEDGIGVTIKETVTSITKNNDGSYTYTNERGKPFTFKESLTTLESSAGGNWIATYVDEEGIAHSVNETITSLTFDVDEQTFTHTSEDGVETIIDISSLETSTTIAVAGSTFTYTDEDGVDTVIDIKELETTTPMVLDAGAQTVTYTDEDGVDTVIDIKDLETTTSVTDTVAGHLIATYTNEDGVKFEVRESVTNVFENGDGTFTYTNEDGTVTTIDISNLETTTNITNAVTGHLIATYTNENGDATDINETITSVSIDPINQTVTYINEDGVDTVIDISNLETTTSVTDTVAGHLIGTYTNEDGVGVQIKETVSTLVDNGDGTYTYTNEDGTTTAITEHLTTLSVDTSKLVYVDENGNSTTIDIKDLETTTSMVIDAGAQTVTYSDEDGIDTVVDIQDLETTTSILSDNTNQKFSFTDEDGVTTTVDITALETTTNIAVAGSTFTYSDEDGVDTVIDISNLETTTSVTDTVDGHLIGTYTNEDGVVVQIKETVSTLVDNGDGTYTYTNEEGVETTLTDTLDGLDCTAGQIAKWSGTSWVCGGIVRISPATGWTITNGWGGQSEWDPSLDAAGVCWATSGSGYAQYDFGSLTHIKAVIVAGRGNNEHWVTDYSIEYSIDSGTNWTEIGPYTGSSDRATYNVNHIELKITNIRFKPNSWNGYPCMRIAFDTET